MMEKRFTTYTKEFKQLLRHKKALAVVFFVCLFVTALFAAQIALHNFSLSETGQVKIALVNEDERLGDNATLQEQNLYQHLFGSDNQLNAAQTAINLIKDNPAFEWVQISPDEYREKIHEGEYYAAFIFPPTYSDEIVSSLSGSSKMPTISYVTFKKNSIQALEGSTQPSPIDSKVNREFYQGILSNLTLLVRNATDRAVSLDSSTNAFAKTGLEGALNDFNSITKTLQALRGSTEKWSTSYSELKTKMDGIDGEATSMISRLDEAKLKLENVRRDIYRLGNAYAGAIFQGSTALSNELNSSSNDLKSTAKSVSEQQKGLDDTIKEAKSVLSKNKQLAETLKKYEIPSAYTSSFEEDNDDLSNSVSDLEKISASLKEYSSEIDRSAVSLTNAINRSIDGQRNRSAQFNNEIYPNLETALDKIAYSIGELRGSLVTLETHADKELSVLSQLGSFLGKSKEALDTPLRTIENARSETDSARSDIETLSTSDLLRKSHQLFRSNSNDYMTFINSNIEANVSHQSDTSTYFKAQGSFLFVIFLGISILLFTLLLKTSIISHKEELSLSGVLALFSSRLGVLVTLCVVQAVLLCVILLLFGIVPGSVGFLVLGIVVFVFCGASVLYAVQFLFPRIGKALVLIIGLLSLLLSVGVLHPQLLPIYLQTLMSYTPVSFAVSVLVEPLGAMNVSVYLQAMVCLVGTTILGMFVLLLVYTAIIRFDIHSFARFSLLSGPLHVVEGRLDYYVPQSLETEQREASSAQHSSNTPLTIHQIAKEYSSHAKKYKQVKTMLPVIIIGLIIGSCLLTFMLNFSLQDRISVIIIDALVFIVAAAYGAIVEKEHTQLIKRCNDAGIDLDYVQEYSYSDIQEQDVHRRLRSELDNEEYFPHEIRSYPTIKDSSFEGEDEYEEVTEDGDEYSSDDEQESVLGFQSTDKRG